MTVSEVQEAGTLNTSTDYACRPEILIPLILAMRLLLQTVYLACQLQ